MEPTRILWDQIRTKLPASEVEEVRKMIGSKLIDEVEVVAREVDALEEILALYRETLDEEREKRRAKPKLLPPPVIQYVEKEIQFFVEHLRERASKHGIAPDVAVRPSTPGEAKVLRYLSAKSPSQGGDGGRPMTAPSCRQRQRPHTVDGSLGAPSRYLAGEGATGAQVLSLGSRPGTARPSTAARPLPMPVQEISVSTLHTKYLAPLRTAFEAERDSLTVHGENLRAWIYDEHDSAIDEVAEEESVKPPPLVEMQNFSSKLQKQYLAGDPIEALAVVAAPESSGLLHAAAHESRQPSQAVLVGVPLAENLENAGRCAGERVRDRARPAVENELRSRMFASEPQVPALVPDRSPLGTRANKFRQEVRNSRDVGNTSM